MSTPKAIGKILLSATVIAADQDISCCKRTDLPFYQSDSCEKQPEIQVSEKKNSAATELIESSIHNVRVTVDDIFKQVKKYETISKEYVKDGMDNAQWLVNYLGDEENQAPKAPAIAIGGLTGLIFGLRGGFFKKVIYTSVGALGMASVCYPKEAKEYGSIALDESHKYATIAYNFAYGEEKEDLLPGGKKRKNKYSLPKKDECPEDSCPLLDSCPLPAPCPDCKCGCGAKACATLK